ncbi:MAG: hypothetical protein ACRDSJ_04270, partial [Rubrobacteraceae bacterium]
MARRLAIGLALALFFLAPPGTAVAHAFGQRYDLPVPLWLYLYGASAAVLLSFVLVGFFVGGEHAPRRYPRFDLLSVGFFRATLASRPFLLGLRVLSVALFLLVVASGLLGAQSPRLNFAPTFVWVIWWVGMGFFTAFVGNFWAVANPWRILFEWADGLARRLGVEEGLEMKTPYPASWGVWPAVALFFVFVWIELVFWGAATPNNIVLLALFYSSLTWTGMALFGKETWLRRGEVFSVFFGVLAKFAPTETRVKGTALCVNCRECFARAAPEERELNLRPPAAGLFLPEEHSVSRLVFVVFMLAAVTCDGLMATAPWVELFGFFFPFLEALGGWGGSVFATVG